MTETRRLTDHMPALMRTARALTRSRDAAEDLAQEALLRVWTRLDAGEPIEDLRPYLLTTVRNLARRPRRPEPADAAPPEAAPGDAADRLAWGEVMAAMADLPPEQAALLARAAVDDATIAQIAAEAGLPLGTVASRVSRARARLRARLGLGGDNPVADLLGR